MRILRFLSILASLGALCIAPAAAEPAPTRVGVKLLPFSGVTWPHQQLAGYRPAPPLGLGLEIYYTPRFSLSVDLSTSWHDGGPGGDSQAQLSSFQILGRWWFPGETWSPFLQAGLGGYQAELDGEGEDAQYGGVGVSFGGGAEVPLRERFFLQGELRSNWVQGENSAGGAERWMGHSQVLLWVGYKLP
ncbi:MAG: outer membrane beta-barrel protein [Proteobacteria bacterium]|nr:outer membrane beta-barrel protein [Pseudomonadota bacterium]